MTSLSACHPAYPTGCSHSANPQYDAYLNLLKNQTPAPSSGISRYITQTSIQSLDANTPAGITSHNHANFAATLSGPGIKEGNIVGLVGYLYFVAQPDGKHIFSATYNDHLAAIRLVRNRR